MTPAQIQDLIDACRTGPSDLVMWAELKAVLEGLKNQDGVTSFNARQGIVVGEEGDYNLSDMGDVVISVPTTNQILRYDGSDWVNDDETVYVPYTGATANVTLGEYGIKTGWYGFDLTPTGTPTDRGTMYWDDSRSTVALIMNGTTQHIGQDQFYYVKNSTGTSIPKGTAVGFAGTDGGSGHLLIKPFRANGVEPSSYFMGVTAESIANGAFGQVMAFGKLRGVNTSAFTDGDILYVSTATAGAFQTTVPTAPNNIIQVAAVVNAANNGTIVVRPTLGSKLTSDESVVISSPTNGQVLQYNSTTGVWQNATISTTNIYTADGTLTGNRTVTLGANQTLTFRQDQNALTQVSIENRTTGTGAFASLLFLVDLGKTAQIFKYSSTKTAYKIINSLDFGVYNGDAGDIAIMNDATTGRIKFAAGGASTAQMTIFSNGNVGIGTTTDAGFRLDVNGTARFSSDITVNGIPIGVGGGNSNTNVRAGSSALAANTTGTSNTAIGNNAMQKNTTGVEFVALGVNAARDNLTGSNSVAVGSAAFLTLTSGNENLAIGHNAGRYAGSGTTELTSVNQAIYVGFRTRASAATGVTNEIVIGNNVVGLGSNTSSLGNSSTTFGRWYGSLLIGTSTDVASSILTLSSTTKGFLMPRMTTTQRNAITSPATGLIVYDTTDNEFDYYNGSVWVGIRSFYSNNGTLTANRTVTDGGFTTTFTGTVFLAQSTGYVGIGATADTSYKLSVDGDLRVYGNIRTAQPTGGTAVGVWRLGSTATGTFTVDTGICVEVEIGGTLRKLAVVT